jgi:hypothetical protein
VPFQHCQAMRNVDEDTDTEVRNFKKCLIQMAAKQGKEVGMMRDCSLIVP